MAHSNISKAARLGYPADLAIYFNINTLITISNIWLSLKLEKNFNFFHKYWKTPLKSHSLSLSIFLSHSLSLSFSLSHTHTHTHTFYFFILTFLRYDRCNGFIKCHPLLLQFLLLSNLSSTLTPSEFPKTKFSPPILKTH